jgi:hypothetical protein
LAPITIGNRRVSTAQLRFVITNAQPQEGSLAETKRDGALLTLRLPT